MESFDLPTLDGLHLVPGLCEGVCLGAKAFAGFPFRNKSMAVHIQNPHENRKVEDIAQEMVGKRTFIGWPFLQEGLVTAVSDSLFKYEKLVLVPGTLAKVVSNPHSHQSLSHWKGKAERIETLYSKRCGVITVQIRTLRDGHAR
ncbi:hypothetical protein BDR07DRAFT_1452858 [Suillus spraguei]|nr:hypothetical protein BDR07DRAFT_1452858 [Suillus spraguei]